LKSPIRQVYLAGDAAAVAEAAKHFAPLKQFELSVLDPKDLNTNWQVISSPPGPETAAALGAALVEGQGELEKRCPNLMERILAESREPLRPILLRSLLPVAAMLFVAVGLFALFMRERIAVHGVQTELEKTAPVRARARELQLTLAAADAKLTQLTALQEKLPKPNWGQLLTRIAQSMPDDVWLDSLVFHDAKNVSLSGASYADGGVYDFVGYLKKVPDIGEIALEGTGLGQSATGPTTSFDLKLSLAASNSNDQESRHD
jgi:Tfp pilus assembly protein PilN